MLPKAELLVDLKSCPPAGDTDCSSLGVGTGLGEEENEIAVLLPFFQRHNIAARHLSRLNVSLHWRSLSSFTQAMVELEGADEGSFSPMVVPLTIGRWSLH